MKIFLNNKVTTLKRELRKTQKGGRDNGEQETEMKKDQRTLLKVYTRKTS